MNKKIEQTERSSSRYILEAIQVEKHYPSGPEVLKVLKGIDVNIQPGEILVIMGPSGAGKSTLLHIMGTLDKPTVGEVIIDQQRTSQFKEKEIAAFRNKNIGFVFQFHYLLPEFTALENLMIPRMIMGQDWKDHLTHTEELLNEVGLSRRMSHKPSQLSGGELQRVAVARALVNNPKLVLADEPTGNLDTQNSQALFDLILRLNEKYKQTFVIVTHNEMFAGQANRVIHLLDGRIEDEKIVQKL
ncbi:MAG: ABC transporter ATP-binding protein [Calditrichaeota bacterium]|nr:ABC transporter ATP-binding protein [Calditrichota bacterium]RQW03088.1 MAG: ABC transporter ATP-binding protein [Calditrichota bacterium]